MQPLFYHVFYCETNQSLFLGAPIDFKSCSSYNVTREVLGAPKTFARLY